MLSGIEIFINKKYKALVNIFYSQFSEPFSSQKWTHYFHQMPLDIQERVLRYRRGENKYQLLLGRLLLKTGMAELGFSDFDLNAVFYNENNCPVWKPQVRFNISHSGNVVACAFSENLAIGLDIEKIKPIDLKDFEHILNEGDYQTLALAKDVAAAFFKIWTIKEAVTKALGKGLAIDVQQIFIKEDYAFFEGQKWYFQSFERWEGFAAHLVANQPVVGEVKLFDVAF